MNITKQRFITINKYAVAAAIILYFIGVFTPLKVLQPGILFVFGAGFFCLLQQGYFTGRLKLAAHVWLVPLVMACLTNAIPLEKDPNGYSTIFFALTFINSFIPFCLFMFGTTDEQPSKKQRLKIISSRIVVQVSIFMLWLSVTSFVYIRGAAYYTSTRPDLMFWGMFHVFTAAMFPFIIGRVLCGWLCPNATMQDALYKNMDFKRPIPKLPKSIEEQSHTCSMSISGTADKTAPYLPFTLLLVWFIGFNIETIWDLTQEPWWPMFAFMFGLMVCSMLLPWRKLCTHFCWLSGYRALAGQGSLWRIRFNRSKCKGCKICKAEDVCPFYIDIRNQDNEMPASCCLCFSCMEACPFDGVITFRRAKEEKERLKAVRSQAF
jgi:polyferredoxin